MVARPDEKFLPLRNPGSKGWNAFDEPSAIDDLEVADIENMVYDNGFLSPREGATLLYGKPDSETGDPLQLIKAQTSDGVRYLVAVYANHFYVRHPDTDDWVRINNSYVPAQTTRRYGYANWNNGRGDDRLYVCNGVDDFIRWDICVAVVNGAHVAGGASLTVVDGSRFPTGGGTIILKASNGTFFTEAYTSRSGNVFTLTNTLNSNVDSGAPCVAEMIQKASMEIGKYVNKNQRRLIVANYYGGETVIWGSVQGDPEDFSLAATIAGAFTQTIADGNGEITGLHDFAQFLVIEKEDSLHSLQIQVAADLGSKLIVIQPFLSGESMGPLSMDSTVKALNHLYYPTRNNGFLDLYPTMTNTLSGNGIISATTNLLSVKISPFIDDSLELGYARSAAAQNKIYWAVARQGATQNTFVLAYDLLRTTWTRHSGWGVKDLVEIDDEVLFLDNSSGEVFQINNGAYNDDGNEYLATVSFKRYDFGEIGRPKSQDLIYVQGYMTPASEFFIDVFFNEEGKLGKQTFRINKDTENLQISAPVTDEMGAFIMGHPIMGMSSLAGIASLSFFRCYLGINISKGFFNLQPRAYGTRAAFWGITGMAMNPQVLPIVPFGMVINPETSV